MHFLSVEIAGLSYLFAPITPAPTPEDTGRFSDIYQHSVQPELPWRFNHLHDLESLWWVAVWIVFNNRFGGLDVSAFSPPESDVPPTPQAPPDSIRKALFPSSFDNVHRRDFFITKFSYIQGLPEQYQTPFLALNALRTCLVMDYRAIQSTLPKSINLDASGDGIYNYFKGMFDFLRDETSNHTLMSMPTVRAQTPDSKRKRGEPTDGMGRSSRRRSGA